MARAANPVENHSGDRHIMAMAGDGEARAKLERYLPHKRLARPDEIAGTAVYLASDASAYLTGQVVWVDGGALSHV